MALKPENPVVAGTVLRRDAIRSPNYVAGSAGWTINQDGSAEFNHVTIRNGDVISGTQLFYSGPPAAGNLIASIAPAAGTDPYGNAYLAGEAAYHTGLGSAVSLADSALNFWTGPASGAGPWTQNFILAQLSSALLQLTAAGGGTTLNLAPAVLTVNAQITAPLYAEATPAWHTPGLGTGWASTGSPYGTVQYALNPAGVTAQRVWIRGRVNVGTGQNIFTLPAAYRPAFTAVWPATVISGAAAAPGAYIQVMGTADTAPGSVRLINPGTVTVADITGSFPLD